jgi:hypothetical protein
MTLPASVQPTSSITDVCSYALAQLNHTMECIDSDNWMTDVLDYKTYMVTHEMERAEFKRQPLKHYAAVV